jgi:hypothetical protein
MRRFIAIIILTLVLTGFDSATHVFGAVVSTEKPAPMKNMDCCPDKEDGKSKMAGMACHYCCASLPALSKAETMPAVFRQVLPKPSMAETAKSDRVYRLLRPPRSLS